MTYETYIFIPNPDKKKHKYLLLLYVGMMAIAIVTSFFWDVAAFVIFVGVWAGINFLKYRFKFNETEKVSNGRLGNLPADKLILSETYITFNGRKVAAWELKNVQIYADVYIGKPKGLSGESHGTDNRIEFELDDKKHSIQFQVRKRTDLQLINDIAVKIENGTSSAV